MMKGGYAGKILFVDLSTGEIEEKLLEDRLCEEFLGGYGIGVKILYDQIPPNADPLGEQNILGFITGPLTGSGALVGSRFMVVGKSPLTGGWGDSNCGGYFGPELKASGFDGVFFKGKSEKPVILSIIDGTAKIHEVEHLWGQDTYETDDYLKTIYGKKAKVACIGPAGEQCSLIAAIITDKGRAAARSGLAAVMGSKKLKAVVVSGQNAVPVADAEQLKQVRAKYLPDFKNDWCTGLRKLGTASSLEPLVQLGDTPVKNWGGSSEDYPNPHKIGGEAILKYQEKKYGCSGCAISCGGWLRTPGREGKNALSHKVQYESLGAFGPMCLNEDLESIIKANDLCNRYGLDTISVGGTIAFAIECYENGILNLKDTDGLELTWGNGDAIAKLTEKICLRDGFGELLADGCKKAAERIGRGAEQYAIHVGGQELPMHDPRMFPGLATTYITDATPGRHTQGSEAFVPPGLDVGTITREEQSGLGKIHKLMVEVYHVMSCAGLCYFSFFAIDIKHIEEFINAIVGWKTDLNKLLVMGERINNLRHAFNLREGIHFTDYEVNGRIIGRPPLTAGPHAGFMVEAETLINDYLEACDWDTKTLLPSQDKLEELGLASILADLK